MKCKYFRVIWVVGIVAFVLGNVLQPQAVTQQNNGKRPDEIRELQVNYVEALEKGNNSSVLAENVYADYAAVYESKKGEFGYMYRFTLDQPCYINIGVSANVFSDTKVGNYQIFLGDSLENLSFKADEQVADGSQNMNYINALEAGTYYVKLNFVHTGDNKPKKNISDNAVAKIYISAQRMRNRSGNQRGTTFETAIPASKNETARGIITGITGTTGQSIMPFETVPYQIFRIQLQQESVLKVSAIVTRCYSMPVEKACKMQLFNAAGQSIGEYNNADRPGSNMVEAVTQRLAKGAYYVKVSYPEYAELSLLTNYESVSENTEHLKKEEKAAVSAKKKTKKNLKKIKTLQVTARSGKRKVMVKTIKRARITVVVGKKKYISKSNKKGKAVVKTRRLKKGMHIKVKVTKSGCRQKLKKVTVK